MHSIKDKSTHFQWWWWWWWNSCYLFKSQAFILLYVWNLNFKLGMAMRIWILDEYIAYARRHVEYLKWKQHTKNLLNQLIVRDCILIFPK